MTSSRRPARRPEPRRRQRGLATLILTLALVLAALLAALYVHRNVLAGQLALANQQRSVVAFEAAEAGLDWALASLNDPQPIDADCDPSAVADAADFRTRQLRIDAATGAITPTPGAGAVCVRGDAGWACRCAPGHAPPALAASDGEAPTPAFRVEFATDTRAGVVHARAFGCTRPAGACAADAAGVHDARAHVEADFALLPAVRTVPREAASGGAIEEANAGGSPAAFVELFGFDRAAWRAQPAVRRIDCTRPCAAEVAQALAASRSSGASSSPALLWIDGDVALDGPISLGSAQRPAVLVVDGTLRVNGAADVHGLLVASAVHLAGTPQTGTRLRGAVVSASTLVVEGGADLQHDPAALALLQHAAGSFVRVPGSWRDDR